MNELSVTIVDDEEFMLDLFRTMLLEMGVESVQSFTSARRALETIQINDENQVVLCDLNMPDMDGVEFLRHLAKRDFLGSIVLLSGEDPRTLQTVQNLVHAHKLRLLGAVRKPVDKQSLWRLLNSIFPYKENIRSREMSISVEELCEGIADDAIVPFFQPQVDINTNNVVGVEALARWRHPSYGIVGPDAFISVAEKSGMIVGLTDSMFRKSMPCWHDWHRDGFDLTISMNISMDCLSRIDFPEQLLADVESFNIPMERLMLEITESRLMQDIAISLDVLTRLCLKRVRLSIDDFGTAYSNMEKLQMLPFSELKIDRAFVNGASNNPSIRAIQESSAALGKQLNMQIVAEGVESQADWDCVADTGCNLVQGFFVARPMPSEELIDWLENWN